MTLWMKNIRCPETRRWVTDYDERALNKNKLADLATWKAKSNPTKLSKVDSQKESNHFQAPENLNALSERIELYEKLKASMSDTQKELPAIREQFAILEKYEVHVEESVHEQLDALSGKVK